MKISKTYLKKLILESLEEIYVKGDKEDKFVGPEGNIKATAPKYGDRPKIRYETTDEEFLSALAPIVSLSQEQKADEEGISLKNLLYFMYQRKDAKNAKRLAADFNAEFENIGGKFNEDTVADILNVLNVEKNINNTDDIIKRLKTVGAEGKVGKYTPDKDAEPAFKTANYRGPVKKPKVDLDNTEPDFTPPKLIEKKVRVKYSCH